MSNDQELIQQTRLQREKVHGLSTALKAAQDKARERVYSMDFRNESGGYTANDFKSIDEALAAVIGNTSEDDNIREIYKRLRQDIRTAEENLKKGRAELKPLEDKLQSRIAPQLLNLQRLAHERRTCVEGRTRKFIASLVQDKAAAARWTATNPRIVELDHLRSTFANLRLWSYPESQLTAINGALEKLEESRASDVEPITV